MSLTSLPLIATLYPITTSSSLISNLCSFQYCHIFKSDLGAVGQEFSNTNFKERQVSKVFESFAISLGEKKTWGTLI